MPSPPNHPLDHPITLKSGGGGKDASWSLPSRFLRPWGRVGLCLLLLSLTTGGAHAAPPAAPPAAAAPLPDYGGREAPAVPMETGTGTTSPVVQAGRTLGALVIVLGGVVGVITLLKRAGFVGGNPVTALLEGARRQPVSPASHRPAALLTVTQSQPLPGGGTLHLVVVHDKTLLVGATAQNVTLLAEWEMEAARDDPDEARVEEAAFTEYLTRAGIAPITPPSRAAGQRVAGAANRLQDLLARAESSDKAAP